MFQNKAGHDVNLIKAKKRQNGLFVFYSLVRKKKETQSNQQQRTPSVTSIQYFIQVKQPHAVLSFFGTVY